jgi:hypothetical protein
MYFVQYLEIGIGVAAHEFKAQKGLAPELSVYDLKDQLNSVFQYHELIIRTKAVDLGGVSYELNSEDTTYADYSDISSMKEPRQVHSLILSKVPKDFMRGPTPLPNSDWFEMSYIDYEASKSFAAVRKSVELAKQPPALAATALDALFTVNHVSGAEIMAKDPKNEFKILLDGRLFGPFYAVKVDLVTQSGLEIFKHILRPPCLKIPIMTFLPLSL